MNEDLKGIIDSYKSEITNMLSRVKLLNIDIPNMKDLYDLDTNFDDYKIEDISMRLKLESEATDYKIRLLQEYIQELFIERKFNDYKRKKEELLKKEEYLEYVSNLEKKSKLQEEWYKEFIEK